MADDTVRRHVTVHGDVQGVFFRETARRKATEAGVSGWIANRSDGTVEAIFEGPPEAVEELVEFCREGPTAATVERAEVSEQEPEGLSGFNVR
jgi:acylphosphatase